MKSFNLLVALIGLYINSVSAICFFTGAKFEDRDAARQYAIDACKGDRAVFDRWYKGGGTVKKCFQRSPTQRIEFLVRDNEIFTGWGLDADGCVEEFHNVINRCSRGGSSDVATWTFRVDPNKGTCEEARP
ncbi:hypothetical protein J7337_001825 [Fusarium musae]|uniref:Glycan binding protein Y3-like domain-containing protein n=1 Tax=Fusarium musae TaxID=1042133 RepID=A0A9P8DVA7_9HYPO|nr:hypothetical protein J7337_001825 [Fusarium musae]KAG9508261.1 hypothetical protein J7337_001825 [Fusarium musae]